MKNNIVRPLIISLLLFSLSLIQGVSSSHGESISGRVARLRASEGDVAVRITTDGEWIEGERNMPLAEGATISTGPGGFAEVELDGGRFVRLKEESQVTLIQTSDRGSTFRFEGGGIYMTLLPSDVDRKTEWIIPGNKEVTSSGRGAYRLEENGNKSLIIIVREGRIRVIGERESIIVREGEEGRLNGRTLVRRASPKDSWDTFIERRDRDILALRPSPPLTASVSGKYDFNRYGEWVTLPPYGYVWRPIVAAGWAPYRHGRWALLSFGWTWVSYEPWGWVPYHYGSWVVASSYGWVWVPALHYTTWYPSRVRFIYRNRNLRIRPLRPGDIYRAPPRRLRHRRYRHIFNRRVIVRKKVNPFRVRNRIIYGRIVPKIHPSPSRKLTGKRKLIRKRLKKTHIKRRIISRDLNKVKRKRGEERKRSYSRKRKKREETVSPKGRRFIGRKGRVLVERKRAVKRDGYSFLRGKRRSKRGQIFRRNVRRGRHGSFARNFMRRW